MAYNRPRSRQRIRHSKVWNYFELIDKIKVLARCYICRQIFSSKSTTANLWKHLRLKHNITRRTGKESDAVTLAKLEFDHSFLSTHFDDDGKEDDDGKGTVSCKHCQLSFPSNDTKQLSDHLITTHEISPKMQNKIDTPETMTQVVLPKKTRVNKSKIWRLFTKVGKGIAKCKICCKNFIHHKYSANLMNHIQKQHAYVLNSEVYTKESDSEDKMSSYEIDCTIVSNNYYNKEDDTVTCKQCQVSFPSNNKKKLRKHLITSHDMSFTIQNNEIIQTNRSMLKYFKCLDEALDLYQCYTCQDRLPMATITDMEKHLKHRHPNVVDENNGHAKVIISSDGQLYEIQEIEVVNGVGDEEEVNGVEDEEVNGVEDEEEVKGVEDEEEVNGVEDEEEVNGVEDEEKVDQNNTDPFEMDAVYLEDYAEDEKPLEMQKQKAKRRKTMSKMNPDTSSSDESIVQNNRSKKVTAIDVFGKYITTLLKQLPQEVSNKLQADVVRLILETQIECKKTNL